MQLLVDATPEECLAKAQELFSTSWPYGGKWHKQPNRVYLIGSDPEPDTWGRNIMHLVLVLITFGLYLIYLIIKPIRMVGTAEIIVDPEDDRTRLSVAATGERKFQRTLEKWVKDQFPSAEVVPLQEEVPMMIQEYPSPVQSPSQTEDVPNQIKKLAGLRDSGAITAEEFERKKAELLDRM
jgi:hypothetical protein